MDEFAALASAVWWTPGIPERIAKFMPPNDVACSVRLVNRATAALFRSHEGLTVHLSQPCPREAFSARWGTPGVMRCLSLTKRRQLLCLTATSGVLENLELALEMAGCVPVGEVMEAAAAAGQEGACTLLRQRNCAFGRALRAAAKAGHQSICQWLLDNGCPWSPDAAYAAARGGHMPLFDWLRLRRPRGCRPQVTLTAALVGAAEGCDLETLQQLHRRCIQDRPGRPLLLLYFQKDAMLSAAAHSPTPDWRAKIEWLERELGCSPSRVSRSPWPGAATLDDALERIEWLGARGYPLAFSWPYEWPFNDRNLPYVAPAVLEFMVAARGNHDVPWTAICAAAYCGHLHLLRAWHGSGHLDDSRAVRSNLPQYAVLGGQVAVLAWLVEVVGTAVARLPGLLREAACKGDLPMMTFLYEHLDDQPDWFRLLLDTIRGGCEAALDWVLDRCPDVAQSPEERFNAYRAAADGCDAAILGWLRRRLPYQPSEQDFRRCVSPWMDLRALMWLAEETGCEVRWRAEIRRDRWDDWPTNWSIWSRLLKEATMLHQLRKQQKQHEKQQQQQQRQQQQQQQQMRREDAARGTGHVAPTGEVLVAMSPHAAALPLRRVAASWLQWGSSAAGCFGGAGSRAVATAGAGDL